MSLNTKKKGFDLKKLSKQRNKTALDKNDRDYTNENYYIYEDDAYGVLSSSSDVFLFTH